MKINLKRGTEIKPTKTWHMTETNRSCFIWSWSRKATPATADMAKCSFPYIAHLIERKPDEASGKLNRRTKALLEYWNICIRAAQRGSLLGLTLTTFPRTPSHNDILGMSQNATQQNINSKHTYKNQFFCFTQSSLNLCYIKLREALGKRGFKLICWGLFSSD